MGEFLLLVELHRERVCTCSVRSRLTNLKENLNSEKENNIFSFPKQHNNLLVDSIWLLLEQIGWGPISY